MGSLVLGRVLGYGGWQGGQVRLELSAAASLVLQQLVSVPETHHCQELQAQVAMLRLYAQHVS